MSVAILAGISFTSPRKLIICIINRTYLQAQSIKKTYLFNNGKPALKVLLSLVQGCAKVVEIAKPEFKARMTVKLAVAGAFHTNYMAPAVTQLKAALAATNIVTPRIPVISNVDAQPHSDPDTIKDILSRQARPCES